MSRRIMVDLDSTAQKLLNKDPNNPNSPKKTDAPRPGLGFSKSTMASTKPSLRETMAQKKATLAVKNLPARPGSAMAQMSSPSKTAPTLSNHSTTSTKSTATRNRPESTLSVNAGGMSVAPMRPSRRRPEMAARPATAAGSYAVRDRRGPEADSPEMSKSKHASSRPKAVTPIKTTMPKPRPGHASHASDSSIPSPTFASSSKRIASPRGSPVALKLSQSSPTSTHHDHYFHQEPQDQPRNNHVVETFELPQLGSRDGADPVPAAKLPESPEALQQSPVPVVPVSQGTDAEPEMHTPSRTLKVYEDPFTDNQSVAKPMFNIAVLEDRPVNEDAGNLPKTNGQTTAPDQTESESPEKTRRNARLLDSGIAKIKSKNLDVHGFRKLQSLIRDSKTVFADERFESLLLGLFQYLEDSLPSVPADKVQDVKAQILSTIRLLLRKERDNFQPHVSQGVESLLEARASYDARAHVVSGMELLADELVTLGDGSEIVVVLTNRLQACTDTTPEGCRTLSMGLHVLGEMLEKRAEFVPTESELKQLASLSSRCLESVDSGVRMDAMKFCVSLHDRMGDTDFWAAFKDVKEDPKSVIMYYIAKKQREPGVAV